jgi:general stress protein 26
MKQLSNEVVRFFDNQNFVIVSTLDSKGGLHNSCKGLIKITPKGKVYLLDLYKGETFKNLRKNPQISITAVDEHKFIGYSLKGKARLVKHKRFNPQFIKTWNNKITKRITQRVLRNIRGDKGHPRHPEALLPKPQYLIVMQVREVIDLTPQHLK